jgi:hypothetical protein
MTHRRALTAATKTAFGYGFCTRYNHRKAEATGGARRNDGGYGGVKLIG